jgi:AraC-like DNA-binding protein
MSKKPVFRHAWSLLEEKRLPNMGMKFWLQGIRIQRLGANRVYPAHEHVQFEINLMLAGHQRIAVEGQTYTQNTGDLLVIRPGTSHTFLGGGSPEYTLFFLHFDTDDEKFLSLLREVRQSVFPADTTVARKVRPAIDRMIPFVEREKPLTVADQMRFHSAMFELFASLSDTFSELRKSTRAIDPHTIEIAGRIAEKITATVKRQTFAHTSEFIRKGIDDIASELNISPSYCNKMFRLVHGMSPRQYMSDLILNEAKRMLKQTNMQIEHIARLLCYNDVAHFSQQFKRWTGLSPSKFRAGEGAFGKTLHQVK